MMLRECAILAILVYASLVSLRVYAEVPSVAYTIKVNVGKGELHVQFQAESLGGFKKVFLSPEVVSIRLLKGGDYYDFVDINEFISLPYDPQTVATQNGGRITSIPNEKSARIEKVFPEYVLSMDKELLEWRKIEFDALEVRLRFVNELWNGKWAEKHPELWKGEIRTTLPISRTSLKTTND